MNLEQRSSYEILPRLFNSVKALLAGENFLSGLVFSYFKNIYSEAMLMGQEDKLNNAFSRILMGLAPKTGTSVTDFLNDRKKVYEEPIEIY